MAEYLVTWVIELDADSPEEAASMALLVQRDPGSTATYFTVKNENTGETVDVDLDDLEGGQS